jgi:hypothetical protein
MSRSIHTRESHATQAELTHLLTDPIGYEYIEMPTSIVQAFLIRVPNPEAIDPLEVARIERASAMISGVSLPIDGGYTSR